MNSEAKRYKTHNDLTLERYTEDEIKWLVQTKKTYRRSIARLVKEFNKQFPCSQSHGIREGPSTLEDLNNLFNASKYVKKYRPWHQGKHLPPKKPEVEPDLEFEKTALDIIAKQDQEKEEKKEQELRLKAAEAHPRKLHEERNSIERAKSQLENGIHEFGDVLDHGMGQQQLLSEYLNEDHPTYQQHSEAPKFSGYGSYQAHQAGTYLDKLLDNHDDVSSHENVAPAQGYEGYQVDPTGQYSSELPSNHVNPTTDSYFVPVQDYQGHHIESNTQQSSTLTSKHANQNTENGVMPAQEYERYQIDPTAEHSLELHSSQTIQDTVSQVIPAQEDTDARDGLDDIDRFIRENQHETLDQYWYDDSEEWFMQEAIHPGLFAGGGSGDLFWDGAGHHAADTGGLESRTYQSLEGVTDNFKVEDDQDDDGKVDYGN